MTIKMEDIYQRSDMVTMEDDEEIYSDVYENYCRLQRTVTFLTNDGRVTEEWMEEHRIHILKYHEMFPNFSQINPEIHDSDFRKMAQETEVLLINLVQSIHANRFFNTKFYLMLNQHMIKLCQYIFTEDELSLCISKLSI
jgi:hypothetical protein